MSASAASIVKDQEFRASGLVESASVNSITEFATSTKLNETKLKTQWEQKNFVHTFICHLIFYAIFCFSLVLHVLIDLGLGAYIKNKFFQFIEIGMKNVFQKSPVFA